MVSIQDSGDEALPLSQEFSQITLQIEPEETYTDFVDSGADESTSPVSPEPPAFNLQDAINELTDFRYSDAPKEIDQAEALKTLSSVQGPLRMVAVKSKGRRPVSEEEWDKAKLFLYTLSRLNRITPDFSKKLSLKTYLELFTKPEHNFPPLCATISQALIDKFQAGDGFEERPPPQLSISTKTSINKRKSKDDTTVTSPKGRKRSKDEPNELIKPPPPNHPIWGRNGIMRGLMTNGSSTKLDPAYPAKVDFRVYGHNGLTNGDCWPKQIAALRDGAHGSSMGGISGSTTTGAYSVVISGTYDEFDQDSGTTVHYSSPGAKETNAKEANTTNSGTQALLQSLTSQNPIRVLRTAKCRWAGRPTAGYRYDGLYRAASVTQRANAKHGKFLSFELVRIEGQERIAVGRPRAQEVQLFEKVREGY
ncbi:ydg sra domain-containing protein [Rutstroemia sp. NJR-2017a BVV2]|nr:ydg sra domain-containing protein [Rutstroemia sp. NJR-2017a BVV2]